MADSCRHVEIAVTAFAESRRGCEIEDDVAARETAPDGGDHQGEVVGVVC